MGSTSPIKSATVTSGVASFSKKRSLRCNHETGVSSPCCATSSLAKIEIGFKGSSLISEPETKGIYSSKSSIILRANRVFACPRSPSKLMLCLDKIARSNSGTTVFSKPCTPSKTGFPDFIFSRRLCLNSSFMDFETYPDFFSSPSVFIDVIVCKMFYCKMFLVKCKNVKM